MTEDTYSKLADLAARLRSLEGVARNRGSLACDRIANQIGDVRVELERVATDMGNPISPPAEAQPVGRSGVLKRQVVTTYRDGSVTVDYLVGRPSAPVGDAEAILRELLEERDHRTDGDLATLADRCRHLSRGDRDLIDGLRRNTDRLKSRPSAPAEVDAEIRKLCSWKHLMSYNESYFGEPEGELKSTVFAIERALAQQPAAVDEAVVTVPLWLMEKLARDVGDVGLVKMEAAIRRVIHVWRQG